MFKQRKIINWISCVIGILLFALSYFFYYYSYATTAGITYITNNQEKIEKGEEVEITVSIENTKTAAFNFSLYFDELKLEYISGPENTNVIGNRVIFVWYDINGGSGAKEGELAKFKFRAKKEGLATFSMQGEFYNQVGQQIQTDFKENQIQIGKEKSRLQKQTEEEHGADLQSSNASLQALRLNKEGITPTFETGVNEYYLTVSNDVQNIEVFAISENSNATVKVTGNTDLQEGLNFINILVTSQDKTQSNIYTIQVTKTADIKLANTNLEILAIENVLLNPPFDINEINYKTEVSNETKNINIIAVPENELATVEISGKEDLKEGNKLVTVIVTAPNGFTKKKYKVEVHKRNAEEEKAYQEEQKLNKEMLEQIYKIKELSTNDGEENLKVLTEKQNKKIYNILIGTTIIVIAILIFIKRYLKI